MAKSSKKGAYDKNELSYNTDCCKPMQTAEEERKKDQSKQKWGKILEKVKGK
jgi:hypothetical protein